MNDNVTVLPVIRVERAEPRIELAVAAERERCAVLVGSWPTKGYGTFDERLKVQQACVDMAKAIRSGKDRAGFSDGEQ